MRNYQMLLAVLTCVGISGGGAGSGIREPTASETAIQTLDRLRGSGQQKSVQERRLRFYLLKCGDARQQADAEEEFPQDPTGEVPLDVQVRRLAAKADRDVNAARELSAIADRNLSMTASLLWVEVAEARSKGSLRFAGRELVVGDEPAFLPAISSLLQRNRANWLVFARYGSVALDLLDEGTAMARGIIAEAPGATEDVTTRGAAEALKRFTAFANAATWRWSEKHPAEKTWVEASLLYHAGQYESARFEYESIVQSPASRPTAYYRLARLYELAQRQKDADATVLSGLAKYPEKNSPLLVLAAEYDTKRGNVADAIQKLQKCVTASPEYAPAHMQLAEAFAMRGERESAITSCANALAYGDRWGEDFRRRANAVLQQLVKSGSDSK